MKTSMTPTANPENLQVGERVRVLVGDYEGRAGTLTTIYDRPFGFKGVFMFEITVDGDPEPLAYEPIEVSRL